MSKVWAFLILFSFVAALATDFHDIYTARWENGKLWKAEIIGVTNSGSGATVRLVFEGSTDTAIARHIPSEPPYLAFSDAAGLPEALKKRVSLLKDAKAGLRTTSLATAGTTAQFTVSPLRWLKLTAIADAAFDMAKTAVTLAIGLIGVMALWLGLLEIAERSGLVQMLVKVVRPVVGKLFPDLPADDPALGHISLNLAANVLGLGNSATPLGIKAMESLKKHLPDSDEASDAMCMFLAINTSSVQLLPPVTLVALMGTGVAPLMVSITLATIVSTSVAVALAFYERKRRRTAHG